ncbi:hypothetical protein HMPREF9140_00002 [Prevotella micans F0438]|uniref:Uncharacterized protein n=1 Tax=Prevotella micans F0438 TaxID=883158 RepID=H1PZB4_9BACT|nr:hypothetical protein HMPREF9140_00002 [Prevotella micans F0438]
MAEIHKRIKCVFLPWQKYINRLKVYFFHGRNTLNDLVYHSSSYFTRVLFNRDSHSGGTPACRDRPRVCPHPETGGNMLCGR